jgi:hypothetical protein
MDSTKEPTPSSNQPCMKHGGGCESRTHTTEVFKPFNVM